MYRVGVQCFHLPSKTCKSLVACYTIVQKRKQNNIDSRVRLRNGAKMQLNHTPFGKKPYPPVQTQPHMLAATVLGEMDCIAVCVRFHIHPRARCSLTARSVVVPSAALSRQQTSHHLLPSQIYTKCDADKETDFSSLTAISYLLWQQVRCYMSCPSHFHDFKTSYHGLLSPKVAVGRDHLQLRIYSINSGGRLARRGPPAWGLGVKLRTPHREKELKKWCIEP
jgi:hypothetical protein